MESLGGLGPTLVAQLQKPTLAFLMGGMLLAALGSRLRVPEAIHTFIVIVLLLKVGLGAGLAIRETALTDLVIPALAACTTGTIIVALGWLTLARWPGVAHVDGMATAGLFGAVSASTLAAGMGVLDADSLAYEPWIAALYPFMDLSALLVAIVLARTGRDRQTGRRVASGAAGDPGAAPPRLPESAAAHTGTGAILVDTVRSPAISALVLGLALGLFARVETVHATFYEPLFRGLLSLLMLMMGMEAWARLSELRKVAHAYALYALAGPLVHGLIGLMAGWAAHALTGFSPGGAVLLAVMAASSSDISGPPTLRAALPEANPSAYVGASTGLGTPVAILSIPLWVWLAGMMMPA